MKTAFYLNALVFIVGSAAQLKAHTHDVLPLSTFREDGTPVQSGGPIFTTIQNGISLSVQFSPTAKDLSSLKTTLILSNQSSTKLVLHDFGSGLCGLDFHMEDTFNRDIAASAEFEEMRQAGRKDTLIIGEQTYTLNPGDALRVTMPVTRAVPITSLAKYLIQAYWTDSEFPGGRWVRSDRPTLVVQGKILLRKTDQGISITSP